MQWRQNGVETQRTTCSGGAVDKTFMITVLAAASMIHLLSKYKRKSRKLLLQRSEFGVSNMQQEIKLFSIAHNYVTKIPKF